MHRLFIFFLIVLFCISCGFLKSDKEDKKADENKITDNQTQKTADDEATTNKTPNPLSTERTDEKPKAEATPNPEEKTENEEQ